MKAFVNAVVGFAAGARGEGVAYVRLGDGGAARVLRVPFGVKRLPALLDREVGYAALTAVSTSLHRHGFERVRFQVEDARLAHDVGLHAELPHALALAYVRLGCALNQLQAFEIAEAGADAADLTARARSEVAMHKAA